MFSKIHAALARLLSGGVSVSEENAPVWLVVGLGNPDREHEGNRHNIGFMAVERIAADCHFAEWRRKFSALVAEGTLNRTKVLLMKPQTYMNRSGQSVAAAAQFYKIPPDKIIVLHDELDLPLGKVRNKIGGGAAGHNGLKSIDADMGSQDYVRVRIGIGHPGDKNRVSGYVLSDFTADERDQADIIVAAISRHIEMLMSGDDAAFANQIAEETKGK